MTRKPGSRVRRLSWRGFKTGLVITPGVVVAVWLVFQHKPGWYRPGVATEATIHKAQKETAALADLIGDNLVEGRPFELTLVDHQVNGWLACLDHVLPNIQFRLPPALIAPAVQFEDGRLRIGVHYSDNGWEAILSAVIDVELTDDGRSIRIALVQIRGGSLNAPRWLLERLLEPYWRSGEKPPTDGAGDFGLGALLSRVSSADELFEGVTIRNRFVWPNGQRAFRVNSIRSEGGTTRIRIEPL